MKKAFFKKLTNIKIYNLLDFFKFRIYIEYIKILKYSISLYSMTCCLMQDFPFFQGEYIMNKDIALGKWKQIVGKAKVMWGNLTDNDLEKVEGSAEKLAGLVQEQYGKTREEAEKEVKTFFDENR